MFEKLVLTLKMYRKPSGITDLRGKICLVTGGSRGIGKGIAIQLAYHGATCYVSGRNMETLEKLNKEVESMGGSGKCIPVQCDHENDSEVKSVFERIDRENDGKLDLLVNNAYSAVKYIFENLQKKFWEQSPDAWDKINNVGLRNHYRCAVYASKMMIEKRQGLIINVSSPGGMRYFLSVPYGVGKCAKDRMAKDCAIELRKYKVAFISLWPGLVKTEELTSIKEEGPFSSRYGRFYDSSESTTYVGKTVAALLSEPHAEVMTRSGKVVLTRDVGTKHGLTDERGIVPNSMFQLNLMLYLSGYKKLANFIPDFVQIPSSIIMTLQAYRDT
ncbi:dehydrogenase/reductase SDR family member 1-like [Styela clava]